MGTRQGEIVVVDDDAESLKLLTDILSQEGYHVRPAHTGKLALASIAASSPELILLDMRMPGMDGFEVCRRLKEFQQTRDIPVIFLSGSDREEQHVEGFYLGAVDFVTKPFKHRELLARVWTQLELRRLRVELEKRVAERTEDLRLANEQLHCELADRKRAEETLRESEERFRSMADSTSVMICVCGPDKLATFFNKGWLEFTGRTMEQELGYGWTAGVHPDDLNGCLASYNASFNATPPQKCHIEYRLRRADGEYRSIVYNGVPRYEAGSAFAGYVASVIDVTDVKRTQEEELARQKLESLGVLSAGIAHDFNNLLGSVIAEAGLAEEGLAEAGLAPDSSPHEQVRRIKSIAFRASEIVRELMIYSGRERGDIEALDLSQVVEEMLELLKASISKRVLLRTDLDKNLLAVRGNAPQIRQIVMNLVLNASEAIGEKGGVIHITTSRVSLPPYTALDGSASLPAGDYLQLEVADTGCGMSEDVQAKVFDPFYTTKSAGRGLGLAVVQTIVRNHEGAIKVTSAAGRGTIVRIVLPCADQPARQETTVAILAPPNRATNKVSTAKSSTASS
jgi:PAS domain S-box-containing protein